MIFKNPGQVGMARPRFGNGDALVAVFRERGHFLGPILPVLVFDSHGDRRSHGLAPPDSRPDLNLVFFDQHAAAATVSLLATPKVVIDFLDIDGETGWNPIDDDS